MTQKPQVVELVWLKLKYSQKALYFSLYDTDRTVIHGFVW
jgi:hypothetical protein